MPNQAHLWPLRTVTGIPCISWHDHIGKCCSLNLILLQFWQVSDFEASEANKFIGLPLFCIWSIPGVARTTPPPFPPYCGWLYRLARRRVWSDFESRFLYTLMARIVLCRNYAFVLTMFFDVLINFTASLVTTVPYCILVLGWVMLKKLKSWKSDNSVKIWNEFLKKFWYSTIIEILDSSFDYKVFIQSFNFS